MESKSKIIIPVRHQYSGNSANSKAFLRIISRIENEADRQELYSLGLDLQCLETLVLRKLGDLNQLYVRKG